MGKVFREFNEKLIILGLLILTAFSVL